MVYVRYFARCIYLTSGLEVCTYLNSQSNAHVHTIFSDYIFRDSNQYPSVLLAFTLPECNSVTRQNINKRAQSAIWTKPSPLWRESLCIGCVFSSNLCTQWFCVYIVVHDKSDLEARISSPFLINVPPFASRLPNDTIGRPLACQFNHPDCVLPQNVGTSGKKNCCPKAILVMQNWTHAGRRWVVRKRSTSLSLALPWDEVGSQF